MVATAFKRSISKPTMVVPFMDSSGAYVASVATCRVVVLYAAGTSLASAALNLPLMVEAPATNVDASTSVVIPVTMSAWRTRVIRSI